MTQDLKHVLSEKNDAQITIMLVDDHPLMRQALRAVLEKEHDFDIVAEASDGEEAIKLAGELLPDVVIMDISMPKVNGLEATRQIKAEHPSTIILVITIHDDNEYILNILQAGADGYLLKSIYGDEVITTIRTLLSGERVLSPAVSDVIINYATQKAAQPVKLNSADHLTARELEILKLSAKGITNKEIADHLGLSQRTIKGYLADMFLKLNVSSRTEAVSVSLRRGILSLDDLE